MKYLLTLPLPGKNREAVLELDAAAQTGTITNPYEPESLCPLYDVSVTGEALSCKAMVGRTEFIFSGPACPEGYSLDFTTLETIPLEPGVRLDGRTGELAGEYLVGVYSPGGVKENHFVIRETRSGYSGEMYGLVDEKSLAFMESMAAGGGPGGPGGPKGPGGPPEGAPPMEPMPMPKLGDRTDLNVFASVSGNAESFEVITVTGMGSEFRFTGSVDGDTITMTLHVTDSDSGVIAAACG